ncbi:EAL domain-containing protein [Thalassolituus sp. LLYu03]|uniref:putative bifunctional diguanylate cyclase/phosphodiesterase n=1 Tax=Thalassolituus sp. LLYu03 TaxID=3421656 RepID=UPI003D2CF502
MKSSFHQHIINSVSAGILVLDQNTRIISWNTWMEKRSGMAAAEVLNKPLLDIFPELTASRIDRAIQKALHQNSPSLLSAKLMKVAFPLFTESIVSRKRRQRIVQSIQIKPLEQDGSQYCVISVFDISTSDLRERTLRTQSDTLSQLVTDLKEKDHELLTIFNSTQNGIIIFDTDGQIISVNPAAVRLIGAPRNELTGDCIYHYIDAVSEQDFRNGNAEKRIQRLAEHHEQEREIELTDRDGKTIPLKASFNVIPHPDEQTRFYIFFRDVTKQKKAEERLFRMARFDGVTGLDNRLSLMEKLEYALQLHKRNDDGLSVFFIDLDRFKSVNDKLGHNAGDLLLRMVGDRLKKRCRDCDTLARWAGDEFVLLLEQQSHQRSAITVAEKIIREFQKPFRIEGHDIYIGASIGIAHYPEDGLNSQALISHADQAMYQAKAEGKGVFRFFTAEMNTRMTERLALESELRQAIENEEFVLYYQPQIDVSNGTIAGVEALIRWNHPQKGLLGPDSFIHIAEDCGLISAIGDWVLQEAISISAQWQKRFGKALMMSVNLSPRQFTDDSLVGKLRRLLAAVGMKPSTLMLEITENDLIADSESAHQILASLKALGVKIAIDDFGTGYSSLAYLRTLPVDTLKIDKEFFARAQSDDTDSHIIAAIIELAHALQLEVVAEGIETLSQMELLRMKQCDIAQGFYIGKPMAFDVLENWYSGQKGLH